MAMRVHELHPTLIHVPLVLIPTATTVELLAATRPRLGSSRWALDAVGRRLWWGAAAGGLIAGLAGMAASQEVRADDPAARDAMYVHGIGNLALVTAAFGLATWRAGHRATMGSGLLALGAAGAAAYTAWLGGELVYTHGAGVKSMSAEAPAGVGDSPPLLSLEGAGRLLTDAVQGLSWLLRSTGRAFAGRERLAPEAILPGTASEPRVH